MRGNDRKQKGLILKKKRKEKSMFKRAQCMFYVNNPNNRSVNKDGMPQWDFFLSLHLVEKFKKKNV